MRIDVVTLFPDMVAQAAGYGVTGRARERGLWHLRLWNPREFTTDNHKTVDDRPYGGGPGMVMLAEPLAQAIAAAKSAQRAEGVTAPRVIHLSPAGVPLTHERVLALALAANAGTSCSRDGTKASMSGCWRARPTKKLPSAILSSPAANCRR